MSRVTFAIVHDIRIKRKDNTYAVKLRLTYNRESKYFPLGKYYTIDEWKKIQGERPRGIYKDDKLFFNEIEQKTKDILKILIPFSFNAFELKFSQKSKNRKDVLQLLDHQSKVNFTNGKINTSELYKCTKRSIEKYLEDSKGKYLRLEDITANWLESYENWMLGRGNSSTTIGMYLRNLRTIINLSIEDGEFLKEKYPFGKRKYKIPSKKNRKIAVNKEIIKNIINYSASNYVEDWARKMWLFSYLCSGINIKDIALLKNKNIKGNNIIFFRSKTSSVEKENLAPIVVPILPEAKAIIEIYSKNQDDPEAYLFGIIGKEDDLKIQWTKIKRATKMINNYMGKISIKLGVDKKITTYTARHSYATILKHSGASIEFISESLGHNDVRTTKGYMDSFEDEFKYNIQSRLIDFS